MFYLVKVLKYRTFRLLLFCIINDIMINIFLHTIFSFIWIRLSLWDEYPRVELLGQIVCTFLLLLMHIAKLLSRKVVPISIPCSNVWECPSHRPSSTLSIIIFLIFKKWYYVLICIYLIISEIEHYFCIY